MSVHLHRWGCVPDEPLPIRQALVAWSKPTPPLVRGWVERQGPGAMQWVKARCGEYAAAFPKEKPGRLWHEAGLDLFVWQRGNITPADALVWLVEWEAGVKAI